MEEIKKIVAIIYDIKNGEPYFLILHRVLRWKGWELLKGTIEDNEDTENTVAREIDEEISMKNYTIERKLGKSFDFLWGDDIVKVVDVFLVKGDMKEELNLSQEVIEHDNYKWVKKDKAIELLTFENLKELLRDLKI